MAPAGHGGDPRALPLAVLFDVIQPFPCFSEGFLSTLLDLEAQTAGRRHPPRPGRRRSQTRSNGMRPWRLVLFNSARDPELRVRRDDLASCELVEDESLGGELRDGEVRLRVERFGLSTNNITYAVLGDRLGYWRVFPRPCRLGSYPRLGLCPRRRLALARAGGGAAHVRPGPDGHAPHGSSGAESARLRGRGSSSERARGRVQPVPHGRGRRGRRGARHAPALRHLGAARAGAEPGGRSAARRRWC